MNTDHFRIRDHCRKNLILYTLKAFSLIPPVDRPLILDMGCGTGEPTLALAGACNGFFYAVDPDRSCLVCLEEKAGGLGLAGRIKTVCASVFDENILPEKCDIILAEGLLNVTGFPEGLSRLLSYLKPGGHMIIHDEAGGEAKKRALFETFGLTLAASFELDERVWWDKYYRCMEEAVGRESGPEAYRSEINEIAEYKKAPEKFRSVYYVLRN